MSDVFANELTIVHKGDSLQFVAMAPDVCKTPSPGGPVPVPYPNIAMSSDLADGASSVKIEGNPVALASSNLKMSSGDEGGTAGGGVVSSKIKGKLSWAVYSTDVKIEGKGVVRFTDDALHNGNANNSSSKNAGKSYPGGSGDILCDNCGKSIGDPSHKHFPASTEATRLAESARSRGKPVRNRPMKCGMTDGNQSFTGVAGDTGHPLQPGNFSSSNIGRNLKSGKAIPASSPTDSNKAGNCAEQKALSDCITTNGPGVALPGNFSMRVVQEQKEKVKGKPVYAPKDSCSTCKRVLTSLMCTNDPKED
jgi:uncharacterized protein DUF4150